MRLFWWGKSTHQITGEGPVFAGQNRLGENTGAPKSRTVGRPVCKHFKGRSLATFLVGHIHPPKTLESGPFFEGQNRLCENTGAPKSRRVGRPVTKHLEVAAMRLFWGVGHGRTLFRTLLRM